MERPDKLLLQLNEKYPPTRDIDGKTEPFEIEDVDHLGKYVYQMMQEQLEFAKKQQQEKANENDMEVDSVWSSKIELCILVSLHLKSIAKLFDVINILYW